MGTTLNAVLTALSGTVLILEIVVIVVVIGLIIAVIVLNQRKKNPGGKAAKEAPATAYYADLQQPAQQPQQAGFAPAGQNDPFAGFSSGAPAPAPAPGTGTPAPAPAPAAAPPPAAPAAPPAPAPGTPAGWLPDPSGVPNTLRYWDGSGWTQHVAQRS